MIYHVILRDKVIWKTISGIECDDKVQAPVVQTLDSAIHRIKVYPVDSAIGFPSIYPLDSDLSSG